MSTFHSLLESCGPKKKHDLYLHLSARNSLTEWVIPMLLIFAKTSNVTVTVSMESARMFVTPPETQPEKNILDPYDDVIFTSWILLLIHAAIKHFS